jgi:hypothetical protein
MQRRRPDRTEDEDDYRRRDYVRQRTSKEANRDSDSVPDEYIVTSKNKGGTREATRLINWLNENGNTRRLVLR